MRSRPFPRQRGPRSQAYAPRTEPSPIAVSAAVPNEIRRGCVNTSKPSARAMAASVIPAASAMRTASAVGAETDTITDAPITELFCTDISRRIDDTFAQAKADRKILQIRELPTMQDNRRRAHRFRDRFDAAQSAPGPAVICKRYRGLFGNRTSAQARIAFSPNLTMDDSGRLHHALLRSGLCRAVNCERLPRTPHLCISNTFQLTLLILPVISLIQPERREVHVTV
jgi:hypothetical protein